MQYSSSPLYLVARQVIGNSTGNDPTTTDAKPACGGGGLDTSARFNMGLHLAALFVILSTSTFGIISYHDTDN